MNKFQERVQKNTLFQHLTPVAKPSNTTTTQSTSIIPKSSNVIPKPSNVTTNTSTTSTATTTTTASINKPIITNERIKKKEEKPIIYPLEVILGIYFIK